MNNRHVPPFLSSSLAIRQEIQRFESVHPSIYAIYDIIDLISNPVIAQQIRDHVVCIEDSFVNSQEWTLSRAVPDLRLGIVGAVASGKSALVHRYLTGSYMQEESPEGGRFKKEISVDGHSYLLLIRDEGGSPELQFTSWVDAVVFVFSLENEASFNAIYNFYGKMAHYRNTAEIPFILVGTQDAISETNPRVIEEGRARKLAADLKRCSYYETCATYGLNVDRVFHDACSKIVSQRLCHPSPAPILQPQAQPAFTPNNSRPGTPPSHVMRFPPPTNGAAAGVFPQSQTQGSVSAPLTGSSPSHIFSNSYSKDAGPVRTAFAPSSQPAVPGETLCRGDSFRAPPSPSPSAATAPFGQPPPVPSSQPSDASVGVTPCSTPTTARKSRRKSNLFTPIRKTENDTKRTNGEMGYGRAIPLKQGYLYKKSNKALNKDWKKKYVTLCDDGRLTYHANLHDYMEDVHGKDISLQYTTVKVPGMKPRGSKVIVTPGVSLTATSASLSETPSGAALPSSNALNNNMLMNDLHSLNLASSTTPSGVTTPTSHYQGNPVTSILAGRSSIGGNSAAKDKVLLTSYEALQDSSAAGGAANGLESSSSKLETPNVKKRHRRMKSSGTKNPDCDDCDGYEFCIVSLDNKQWLFEACSQDERDEWVSAIEQQILFSLQGNASHKSRSAKAATGNEDPQAALRYIKTQVAGNGQCADCDGINPEWASLNLGVMLCIECSGVHRHLGSHVSKVRSLALDEWTPGPLAVMKVLGNEWANSVWEGHYFDPSSKPNLKANRDVKDGYIRAKYESRQFLRPPPTNVPFHEQLLESVCRGDVRMLAALLAHCGDTATVSAPIGDRDQRTLLHLAAALPSLAAVQLLLWNNANVRALDGEGRSCLFYARSGGDKDIIELLVQSGCHDNNGAMAPPLLPAAPLPYSLGAGVMDGLPQGTPSSLPSTLPRRKGSSSVGRNPEILDKLQASVI